MQGQDVAVIIPVYLLHCYVCQPSLGVRRGGRRVDVVEEGDANGWHSVGISL